MTSEQTVTGWLLMLSWFIFLPAGILYMGRAIWKWPRAQTQNHLIWERGSLITSVLSLTLGLVLLERLLETAGDRLLPPLGITIFLIGVVLVIVAETFFISRHEWINALTVGFVILSSVGQTIFGMSILHTGLLPGWIGWATIVWSIAWLIILPIARPRDMYYPWLHYIAPLVMGIALLVRG